MTEKGVNESGSSLDVVIPCYQYGSYLADCVGSIQRQGIDKLRILILDNASTDNSVEVAQELAQNDPRIEILARKKNLGPNSSYNAGIDWASADYMMIVDADDLVAENALKPTLEAMDAHPDMAFAYGRELQLAFSAGEVPLVENSGRSATWKFMPGTRYIAQTCRYPVNTVANTSVVVRTTMQKIAGHYDQRLPHSDDFEMWLRLANLGGVAVTSAVQSIRRIHPRQLTLGYTRDAADLDYIARLQAFESFFGKADVLDGERLNALARRSLASRAYWSSLSHTYRRKFKEACDLMRFVSQNAPGMLLLPPVDWLLRMPNLTARLRAVISGSND